MRHLPILACAVASAVLAPAMADAQSNQKVALTCTYKNGSENYILDLGARTVTQNTIPGGRTRQGRITRTTDDKIVMVFGTAEHNTTYTLDRYTLGLSRRQQTGNMDDHSLSFGNEPPVPCRRQQRQL